MSSHAEPSWCRTTTDGTAEATFRWTIDNFKSRPEKCNESLRSSSFTVNGPGELKTKWELQVYPKGKEGNANGEYVSMFLNTKDTFSVNAEYKLDVIDGTGESRESFIISKHEYHDADGKTKGWGRINWLKKNKFDDNPDLLPDGNLTVKCMITVLGTDKIISGSDLDTEQNPDLFVECQKRIGDQLGKAFSDKQFSDIKIQCDGQCFDCHQVILAVRSPVFLAMFQSNMKEKETKEVTIDDFKAEVVSEMLNYIYTGNVSDNDISGIARELLAAADKYQLDLLKNICEERLCLSLEVTNCVELLVLGDMYQTFKLRKMALRLAAENMESIIDTDVFKDLYKQKPELVWEVTKALHKK